MKSVPVGQSSKFDQAFNSGKFVPNKIFIILKMGDLRRKGYRICIYKKYFWYVGYDAEQE